MNDGTSLPNDLKACHQLIQQLTAEREQLTAEREQLASRIETQDAQLQKTTRDLQSQEAFTTEQSRTVIDLENSRQKLSKENEELQLTIRKLMDRLYGRRSERYADDPNQTHLDFGDDADAFAEALAEAVVEAEETLDELEAKRRKRKKKRPRSGKFPEHLPRYEKIVDLPEDQKAGKTFLGYDVVETLEYEPPKLRVRQTKYAKYVDSKNPDFGVRSPEREIGLVDGNRFDTSVAVEIIASRFFYHLPYYRQQDQFAGCGWTPSRSTLLNIVKSAEFVLQPLVEHYRQLIHRVDVLGCDETPVTLVVPPQLPKLDMRDPRSKRILEVLHAAQLARRPSVKARMWAYRSLELPFNVFDLTVSRHRDGPDEMLSEYSGFLIGDCWSGFQKIELRSDERIRRAACWAHARRKLYECRLNHPRRVPVLLALIRELYDIEDRAKEWDPARRLELRQSTSKLILDKIRDYFEGAEMSRVLPKSDFAKAIGYIKNHWDALTLFTTDGRIPIDNNETEQLMKQIAIGRKNWLHIGSVAAGMRSANLMTIVSSAIRNDLDVRAYLQDILDQILAGCTDWESLRADRWKQEHPDAVRSYREDERRDAVDRRKKRRAQKRIEKHRKLA